MQGGDVGSYIIIYTFHSYPMKSYLEYLSCGCDSLCQCSRVMEKRVAMVNVIVSDENLGGLSAQVLMQ